jgi:hypothetical protein
MSGSPPETGNSQSMSNPSATPLATNASTQEATKSRRPASVDATAENPPAPQPPIERITFSPGRARRWASTASMPAALAGVHLPFRTNENAQKKWVTRSSWMPSNRGVPASRYPPTTGFGNGGTVSPAPPRAWLVAPGTITMVAATAAATVATLPLLSHPDMAHSFRPMWSGPPPDDSNDGRAAQCVTWRSTPTRDPPHTRVIRSTLTLSVWRNQSSTTVTLPKSTAAELLNDTAGITYTGSGWDWKSASRGGSGSFMNDLWASTHIGDSYTITFNGTGIDLVTETNSDESQVDVFLDGVLDRTINCATPSRVFQALVYSKTGLSAGQHTLSAVMRTGTYLIADAFRIT